MKLAIKGIAELRARLDRVQPAEIMAQALAEQAERLADAVRDTLATPPGGDHDVPWQRTGALHDSIQVSADGLQAAVGSNDPAAAPQEMGTSRVPPRPFFTPAGVRMREEIARAIGEAVAAPLRGESASKPEK